MALGAEKPTGGPGNFMGGVKLLQSVVNFFFEEMRGDPVKEKLAPVSIKAYTLDGTKSFRECKMDDVKPLFVVFGVGLGAGGESDVVALCDRSCH